jgi:hypothetical protein
LAIAKGSVGEVISHLYVALDQQYIDQNEFCRFEAAAQDAGRKIGGLMNYLRKSDIRGPKYKVPLTAKSKEGRDRNQRET